MKAAAYANLHHFAEVNGVVTFDCKLSTFGVNDPQDNGVGAWGYGTKDNPFAPFVALPQRLCAAYAFKEGQAVTVAFGTREVECFLADIGPAEWTGRGLDVCPSVMERLRCLTDDVVKVFIPLGRVVEMAKRC